MSRISNNINKLHNQSQSNWSKKDLNSKYLMNGGNFKHLYNKSNNTLFTQMKETQNAYKSEMPSYSGIICGSPYVETMNQPQSKIKAAKKSSADLGKGKIITTPALDLNTIQSIHNTLNNDQKMSYLNSLNNMKYSKNNPILNSGGKSSRVSRKNNPFVKDFGVSTSSKLRNHEGKRPQTSAVNHSRDLYDPITRSRINKTSGGQSSLNAAGYNKSQTISGFSHLGRIYAPNFSKEYQKAYNANNNSFRRPKGM